MAWFKVSDNFLDHRKLDAIEDHPFYAEAVTVWLAGGLYCNKRETDGKIPKRKLYREVPLERERVDGAIGALVKAELWHDHGDHWEIHDYLEYQPSHEELEAKRAKEREKKRRQREKERLAREADSDGSPPRTDGVSPRGSPPGTTRGSPRGSPATPDPDPHGLVVVLGARADDEGRSLCLGDINRATERAWMWAIDPKWKRRFEALAPVSPAELHAADLAVRRTIETDGGRPNPGLLLRKLEAGRKPTQSRRPTARASPSGRTLTRQERQIKDALEELHGNDEADTAAVQRDDGRARGRLPERSV